MGKSTWLLNENIANQGDAQDYDSGWGHNYGIGATMWFTENIGAGADLLVGRHTGDYIGTINGMVYNSEVELKIIEIPLLFKARSRNGFFVEGGPMVDFITNATYSAENSEEELAKKDVSGEYPSTNLSALFGFGFSKGISDRIGVLLGFRFGYGITDLEGVDALGQPLTNTTMYPKQETTSAVFGGLQLGVSYIIGD